MNPLDPTSLSPVLRTLRGFLHALVGVLLLVVVARAERLTDDASVVVVWAAATTAVVYVAGALMPVVKLSVHAAAVWLAALLAAWLWLVILTPDAVWLAFPLFFLELHLAGRRGLPAVVVTTLVAVGGSAWHAGGVQVGGVLGPLIGAAVVVATVRAAPAPDLRADRHPQRPRSGGARRRRPRRARAPRPGDPRHPGAGAVQHPAAPAGGGTHHRHRPRHRSPAGRHSPRGGSGEPGRGSPLRPRLGAT